MCKMKCAGYFHGGSFCRWAVAADHSVACSFTTTTARYGLGRVRQRGRDKRQVGPNRAVPPPGARAPSVDEDEHVCCARRTSERTRWGSSAPSLGWTTLGAPQVGTELTG